MFAVHGCTGDAIPIGETSQNTNNYLLSFDFNTCKFLIANSGYTIERLVVRVPEQLEPVGILESPANYTFVHLCGSTDRTSTGTGTFPVQPLCPLGGDQIL